MAITIVLLPLNLDKKAVIIVSNISIPYRIVSCFFMAKKLDIVLEKAIAK